MRKLQLLLLVMFVAYDALACRTVRVLTNSCIAGDSRRNPYFTIGGQIIDITSSEVEVNVWDKWRMSVDNSAPGTLVLEDGFLCCPAIEPEQVSRGGDCVVTYTFACEQNPPLNLRAVTNDATFSLSFEAFHPTRIRTILCKIAQPTPDRLANVGDSDTVKVVVTRKGGMATKQNTITVPVNLSDCRRDGKWTASEQDLKGFLNGPGATGASKALVGLTLPLSIQVVQE